jgi:flagellar biosynthesis/type III secretory pathway protein FliH
MDKYALNVMRYDVLFNKYKTMSEMCDMQTLQNYRESKLKVIAEAGTVEDLGWLYKEAADENEAKQKNIIARMIDALVKFIKSVFDQIKALFDKTEEEEQQMPPEQKSFFAKIKAKVTGAAASVVSFGTGIADGCKKFAQDVLNGDEKAIALAIGCGTAVSIALTYGGIKGYNKLKDKTKVKATTTAVAKKQSGNNGGSKSRTAAFIPDSAGKNAPLGLPAGDSIARRLTNNIDESADDAIDAEYRVINKDETDSLTQKFQDWANEGIDAAGDAIDNSKQKAKEIIAKIKDIVEKFGNKIKDSKLAQSVTSILHSVIQHLQKAGSTIANCVRSLISKVKEKFGKSTKEESAFDLFDDDDDFDLFNESDNSSFGDTESEFDYLFDDFVL